VQALVVMTIAALLPAVNFAWQYGLMSVAVAVAVVLLLNLFLCGLGQWLASRIRTMQGFHLVMNLVLFPFLFFSGAFFPLDELPVWLQVLGRINPLSYAVDALLLAMYADGDDGHFGLALDLVVLGALAALVFYAGTGRRVTGER
jgi:ABC-2 type transport system permease protein